MSHPSDGALRRMLDEPLAVPEWVGRHFESCGRCHDRYHEISSNASAAIATLNVPQPAVDSRAALVRFRNLAASSTPSSSASAVERLGSRLRMNLRFGRPATVAATAGLLAVLVAVSAMAASGMIQIAQPKRVQTVTLQPSELQGLPDLSQYGTMKQGPDTGIQQVPSLAAAVQQTGLPALKPATLPADVPGSVTYDVSGSSWRSFTFSAEKARESALSQGRVPPVMPANIDGSTLVVNFGPALAEVYGMKKQAKGVPTLAIVEMKAPRVTSTGLTVKQLEDYLLQQPGVSPALKQQIEAIGDPSSTLPIPVVPGRMNARQVTVQGVNGAAFGDSTGLGAGVIWIKNGVVFVVGGTVSQEEVLSVANSLR